MGIESILRRPIPGVDRSTRRRSRRTRGIRNPFANTLENSHVPTKSQVPSSGTIFKRE